MKFFTLFIMLICLANKSNSQIINDFNFEPEITIKDIDSIINIDPLSTVSIYIQTVKTIYNQEIITGTATGFIYSHNSKNYLITNWHVITGRNPKDNTSNKRKVGTKSGKKIDIDLGDPGKVVAYFHGKKLGTWTPVQIPLYSNKKKIWYEHPLGRKVDVVAIPLNLKKEDLLNIQLYPISRSKYNDNIFIYPSAEVSIIGFPFGFSSFGKFPIWKIGHVATDYDININKLPFFLIDATTRPGMSGSPVIISQTGVSRGGGFSNQLKQRFLGIYSGRLPNDSNLGIVWKPNCLLEIIK